MFKKFLPGFLLLFGACSLFAQTEYPSRFRLFEKELAVLSNNGQFNGAILVADGGGILFQREYGYTDFTGRRKLRDNVSFHLASAGKPLTTLGILLLLQDKSLSLEDQVGKYLPGLDYPGLRIVHLLNHTSGLPDYIALYEREWPEGKLLTNELLLKDFAEKKYPLESEPGASYSYNSTNYVLLASIMERVSGSAFGDFLEKRIFSPLGMHDSFVQTPASKSDRLVAEAFEDLYGERQAVDSGYWSTYGGHGIYSTTGDLYKLDRALRSGRLLRPEIAELAYRSQKLNDGTAISYGLGWEVGDGIVTHSGGWMGFRAFFRRDLKSQGCLVILDSSNNRDWEEIVAMVEAILDGRPYSRPVKRKAMKLAPEELARYCGIFELRPGYLVRTELIGERLYIIFPKRESMEIVPESRELFFLRELNKETTFEFHCDERGEADKLIVNQRGSRFEAVRKR